MTCKWQLKVCFPFLHVILVFPFPGLKTLKTLAGSMPAFTIDWKQSLATFGTVPRKQLGKQATFATSRKGPGTHEWLINTWTVWFVPKASALVSGVSSSLRVFEDVDTVGVGAGAVAAQTDVTAEISGVFFLFCFSGFSGLVGFSRCSFVLTLHTQKKMKKNEHDYIMKIIQMKLWKSCKIKVFHLLRLFQSFSCLSLKREKEKQHLKEYKYIHMQSYLNESRTY